MMRFLLSNGPKKYVWHSEHGGNKTQRKELMMCEYSVESHKQECAYYELVG